jgi:hypothetical protein
LAKDDVGTGLGQRTLLTIAQFGLERLQGLALLLGGGLGKILRGWGLRHLGRIKGDGLGAKEQVGLQLPKAGSTGVAGGFCTHKGLPVSAKNKATFGNDTGPEGVQQI